MQQPIPLSLIDIDDRSDYLLNIKTDTKLMITDDSDYDAVEISPLDERDYESYIAKGEQLVKWLDSEIFTIEAEQDGKPVTLHLRAYLERGIGKDSLEAFK